MNREVRRGIDAQERTQWMVCRSRSGAFLHVSPRLASIYLRIIDVIETEENLSPEGLFDAVLDLLPAAELGIEAHRETNSIGHARDFCRVDEATAIPLGRAAPLFKQNATRAAHLG